MDVAIDYSGAPQALQAALRGVAYGGTVVAGAFPPPHQAGLDLGAEAPLNLPSIVFTLPLVYPKISSVPDSYVKLGCRYD